jgi:hypothetical protein
MPRAFRTVNATGGQWRKSLIDAAASPHCDIPETIV